MGKRRRFFFGILFFAIFLADLAPQQRVEILVTGPIPQDRYQSWSLFLISNQDWLLPENHDKLKELIIRYKNFGDSTGPYHAAVWFCKGKDLFDIDIERANLFCKKYGLRPSNGPYVIFTTEYPGEGIAQEYPNGFNALKKNYSKIKLNDLSPSIISDFLNELTDKIISNHLSDSTVGTSSFWNKLKQSFESMSDSLAKFGNKISLTIKAGPIEAKIGGNK
jgi:hypothetical protein